MNTTTFAMAALHSVFRDASGKEVACLSVDIQSARSTPVGKRFGVDVGAHDDLPIASELLLASLGFHPPYGECVGELVAIGHDPADGVVIFESVPDHADDVDVETANV